MHNHKLTKLLCHCCKKEQAVEFLVPCKSPGCNLFFCHKCLTSRYKYSKVKVSKLPTAHWRCPVCANRCQCTECLESGVTIPIKKRMVKRREVARRFRRKKRIRKPIFNVQTNSGTRTPPSEKETEQFFSPTVHRLMPPISSIFTIYSA